MVPLPENNFEETIIDNDNFFTDFNQPTEQDEKPPVQTNAQPAPDAAKDTKTVKDALSDADDDATINDDIDIYVDAGVEVADTVKDIACEFIAGEKNNPQFDTNPKHLARFKKISKKVAAKYMSKPDPMNMFYMYGALCFLLPFFSAIMIRYQKGQEKRTGPAKPDVDAIGKAIESKGAGRPSNAEIALKKAYDDYLRDQKKK
jgi:hypothetical protein